MKEKIQTFLKKRNYERWEPKVALFDMDGVLYNSMPNHAVSWHKSMEYYGLKISEEEAYGYEGMRGVEVIKKLAKEQKGITLSDDKAQEMYHMKSDYYAKCEPAGLIPGVHELQEEMKQLGLEIGVVTGSGQPSLLKRIHTDFKNLVSEKIFVTANDVEKGKPNPEPYLAGMKKAGTMPWQTMVVENAPLGGRAAVAAGCFTIAVNTGPLPESILQAEGADIVLRSMSELRDLLPILLTPERVL